MQIESGQESSEKIAAWHGTRLSEHPVHNWVACGNLQGKILFLNTFTNKQIILNTAVDLPIWDITWSRNKIASCGGKAVMLSDPQSHKISTIFMHENVITALASHPISPLLLSASDSIVLHDLRSKRPVSVNFATSQIFTLQYSGDGRFFVAGGEPVRVGNNFQWKCTLDPGGASFCPGGENVLLTGSDCVKVFNWREQKIIFKRKSPCGMSWRERSYYVEDENEGRKGIIGVSEDGWIVKWVEGREGRKVKKVGEMGRVHRSRVGNCFYTVQQESINKLKIQI